MRTASLVAGLALALVACDERPPPPLPTDAGDTTPDPGEVVWGSCEGSASRACARIELPRDWDTPDDGALYPVVIRRFQGTNPTRHLWILDGGPGGDVDAWATYAQRMTQLDPRLTVYLFHQRGTGRSGRLTCSLQESPASPGGVAVELDEQAACIASLEERFGEDLPYLSTTAVARDLAYLVDAVREPGQDVLVMGTSYGTYLAQRYLQVAPDQPSGVVLSAIVPPDAAYPDTPHQFEEVAREVLAACGEDPFCSARLGADPAATMEGLLTRLDEGHCDGMLTRKELQRVVARLFYDWQARAVGLALVHRLDRCSSHDRAAIGRFRGLGGGLGGFSWMLFNHVTLSEMWRDGGPTLEEARALEATALLGDGSLADLIALRAAWPRYPLDAFDDRFAETAVPLLMINGSLDPATPLADAARVGDHFDGPSQTFVRIEGGGHGFGAPLENGESCAQSMIDAFVRDPTAPVDDCGARVLPPDFRGTPELASAAFGTPDLWDIPDPEAQVYVAPVDLALTRRLQDLLAGRPRPF